jgi:hypothetical protein
MWEGILEKRSRCDEISWRLSFLQIGINPLITDLYLYGGYTDENNKH